MTYRFADLRLNADGTLLRGETVLQLPAPELALLRSLVTRQGKVAATSALNRALWGEAHPAGNPLAACVASLKKLLLPTDCIESVYRRGYRIQATVEPDEPPHEKSLPLLAVLPFSTGYDVPEYIGLALTEQTMDRLRSAHPVVAAIAARDSVRALVRRGLDRQAIGKMLNAEFLLTGQLLATLGRHRLRVEMIRVEDGAPLWMEDLIAARDRIEELSGELVNRIRKRLHGEGIQIAATADPAPASEFSEAGSGARELYLRAHYEWQSMERHRMQDAMGWLLRAVELDEALLAARVDLAQLAVFQSIYGYLSPRIAAATVRRAAEGITDLNEDAVALLPALGWIEFHFDRNARSALQMMARSELLPYDALNTRIRSWLSLSRHRPGESVELLRAALGTDPWSPWLHATLAWALHMAGECEASVTSICKAIDLFSDFDISLFYGAMILGYNGEYARAIDAAAMLAGRSSHYDLATAVRAYALACAGSKNEARQLVQQLEWLGRERYVLNTLNAATFVALGEPDAAIKELRDADRTRCPWFFQMLGDPRLTPLDGHPEFAELKASHAAMEAGAADSTE